MPLFSWWHLLCNSDNGKTKENNSRVKMVDEYWWNGREKICAWCKQVLLQCMRIQLPNCDVNEGVGTRLAVAAPPPQLFWKKNKNSKWFIHLKLIIWYKRCDTFINIFYKCICICTKSLDAQSRIFLLVENRSHKF